jgi:hypothetical protein
MGYSLYISLNTFVDTDKVSVQGITLPTLGKTITVSQIILDLYGWEFAEEFAQEFGNDCGEIDNEDVLRLYTRFCKITDNEIEQEIVDIIKNSVYGLEHGGQYFSFTQSY